MHLFGEHGFIYTVNPSRVRLDDYPFAGMDPGANRARSQLLCQRGKKKNKLDINNTTTKVRGTADHGPNRLSKDRTLRSFDPVVSENVRSKDRRRSCR